MVILKSIGAFFVRIWRWIKETAWVQPLLIVGAIFAIIFSIPSISNAVNSWSASNTAGWLLNYRYSLNGELFGQEDVTEADKLTGKIYQASRHAYGLSGTNTAESDKATFEALAKDEKKFFLVYINGASGDTTTITEAFRFLQENWNNSGYGLGLHDDENLAFNLKVIYTDEESDNDDDFESKNSPSAFSRYLSNYSDFFSTASDFLYDRPYRVNASIDESKYDAFGCNNTSSTETDFSNSFPKPSIVLCDFTDKAVAAGVSGASEVIYSLTGDSQISRAKFLAQMWNHTDARASDTENNFLAKN